MCPDRLPYPAPRLVPCHAVHKLYKLQYDSEVRTATAAAVTRLYCAAQYGRESQPPGLNMGARLHVVIRS